jgi:hypothetical protein
VTGEKYTERGPPVSDATRVEHVEHFMRAANTLTAQLLEVGFLVDVGAGAERGDEDGNPHAHVNAGYRTRRDKHLVKALLEHLFKACRKEEAGVYGRTAIIPRATKGPAARREYWLAYTQEIVLLDLRLLLLDQLLLLVDGPLHARALFRSLGKLGLDS